MRWWGEKTPPSSYYIYMASHAILPQTFGSTAPLPGSSVASGEFIYNSYAGVDIVAEIIIPGEGPLTLGELQTISYSIHRENTPVRFIGRTNVAGFVKGSRCIPASEKVLIKDKGYISIADVKLGDFVQSSGLTYDEVLGSYDQGIKNCFLLKLENGYTLKASYDHPISTAKGWVQVKDLQIGDEVHVVGVTPTEDTDYPIADDMLKMIALLLGDGSMHVYVKPSGSKEYRISLSIADTEMSSIGLDVENILKTNNIPFNDYRSRNDKCIARRISVCVDDYNKTDWRLRKYNKLHSLLLEHELYGQYSHTKAIPQSLLALLSKRQIIIFLQYLYSTDGGYSVSKDNRYIEAKYTSTSESLIDGIRLLLNKIGIESIKSHASKVGKIGGRDSIVSKHDTFSLVISKAADLLKFIKRIGIFGKDSKIESHIPLLMSRMARSRLNITPEEFVNEVRAAIEDSLLTMSDIKKQFNIYNYSYPITPRRAQKIAAYINSPALTNKVNDLIEEFLSHDNEWNLRKVVHKENIGDMQVYDLEVKDRHSFVCNFIRVHNTIAGSLIFTNFNSYAFYRLRLFSAAVSQHNLYPLSDMLPPFDVVLTFANEYGSISKSRIFGLTIVDEGATMSIDDLITESTFCVDAKTEALTKEGWKTHDQLSEDDEVLTIHPTTKAIQWQQVESIYEFDYDGDLIKWEHYRGLDALTTPTHRWLTTDQYHLNKSGFSASKAEFRTTDELNNSPRKIIVGGGIPIEFASEMTFSNELVELIGFAVTEGHYIKAHDKGVHISQSESANPEQVDRLRYLVKHFKSQNATASEYLSNRQGHYSQCHDYYFGRGVGEIVRSLAPNKTLPPSFLTLLTFEQATLLYETMMAGDGHTSETSACFIQNPTQLVDDFQMLCSMLGKRTSISPHGDKCVQVNIYTNQFTVVRAWQNKPETVYYKGVVWCPKTHNMTWLARRNGSVYWTGNTYMARGIQPMTVVSNTLISASESGAKTTIIKSVF